MKKKKSLFCFYCILFGGEGLWTTVGCKDLKHLSERIKKHEEIINQLKERFQKSQEFGSFTIIDPKKFASFRESFPSILVSIFPSSYSPIICKEKLINELSVIYRNDTFKNISSVCDLFSFFMQHSFED